MSAPSVQTNPHWQLLAVPGMALPQLGQILSLNGTPSGTPLKAPVQEAT
jgi:hypothetical protein